MLSIKWDTFGYSSKQFGIWRIAFGSYLLFYFLRVLPYATELFSSSNGLPAASDRNVLTYYPMALLNLDSAFDVKLIFISCIVLSALILVGWYRRIAALVLWLLVMWLYNRNPYADSPEYPFVNWLIIALALIPSGEAYSLQKKKAKWNMPAILYWGAWIILALAYFFAGSVKFKARDPAWMDGTAMYYVLVTDEGRLPWYGHFFDNFPKILFAPLTYGALVMQTFAFVFIWFRPLRKWWWLVSTGIHLGLALFVNLAEVSLGMAMFHFFIFDLNWLPKKRSGLLGRLF